MKVDLLCLPPQLTKSQLFVTLKRIQGDYAPKSKAGKAIQYILNYEEALQNYMLNGHFELSNNRAESMAIKPFVIERKNWQFANTIKGAHVSAGIYSSVNSANLNHLDSEANLSYVLETMSQADEGQDWHPY